MRIVVVAGSHPAERIGGAELQAMLLSRGLSARGHEVAFVAANAGAERQLDDRGIKIQHLHGWSASGWRRHRQHAAAVIEEQRPDLCYVRAFFEIGAFAPACTFAGIPMVSASSHVWETSPFLLGNHLIEALGYLRTRKTIRHLYSFLSIRSSAMHVCNSESLVQSLRRWYRNKRVRTIYNGSPVPVSNGHFRDNSTGQVLWVNNLKRWKRPEVVIKLAQLLPQIRFVMIGRMPGGRRYARRLQDQIQKAPPNFHYLGPMPIDRVNAMIEQSDLLISTSLPVEGFPNSFIQAWLRSVPTVSYSYELDGIVEREGVGRCPTDFAQLVVDVRDLMSDEIARREMGYRAREYAVRHHNIENMVSDYATLFQQVVDEY